MGLFVTVCLLYDMSKSSSTTDTDIGAKKILRMRNVWFDLSIASRKTLGVQLNRMCASNISETT
jgi:hypothetical protein